MGTTRVQDSIACRTAGIDNLRTAVIDGGIVGTASHGLFAATADCDVVGDTSRSDVLETAAVDCASLCRSINGLCPSQGARRSDTIDNCIVSDGSGRNGLEAATADDRAAGAGAHVDVLPAAGRDSGIVRGSGDCLSASAECGTCGAAASGNVLASQGIDGCGVGFATITDDLNAAVDCGATGRTAAVHILRSGGIDGDVAGNTTCQNLLRSSVDEGIGRRAVDPLRAT